MSKCVVLTLLTKLWEAGSALEEGPEGFVQVQDHLLQGTCRRFLQEFELALQLRELVDLVESRQLPCLLRSRSSFFWSRQRL